jgi:putative ABC transport system permease protein
VRLRALDRKLLRDLRSMRGQAAAIALVIVAGVSTYVAMASVVDSLRGTLDAYYVRQRFPDGFASVRRAPAGIEARLREVPGVGEVETRVTAAVHLEVPGFGEPVSGMLVSVPEGRQPLLNRLVVRRGRLVRPGHEEEVLLNEIFAEAHGLGPGDSLTAIVNGRRRALRVVGVALSPEFLMQMQPGTIFPDPQRWGVLWIGRPALAAAYDMEGAFNDVAFTLAPGGRIDDVIERVDLLLRPYGGRGAIGRRHQPSHFLIHEEFRQLQSMATILPAIFIGVAAFLLNIVVTRLISLQREQVAVLKAFGYPDLAIAAHYLKLVLVMALAGALVGIAAGSWMGRGMGTLYLEFYRFPELEHVLRLRVVVTAAALTTAAALAGVVRAVYRAVRLPPAEAMRPAPPARYRRTLVERLGVGRWLDQPTRMILRSVERQRLKAAFTVLGIAASAAILVMGLFWGDAIERMVRVQFGVAQREDLAVTFTGPTSTAALHEIAALPGVLHAEPARTVPVRLRAGHRSYDTAVEGIPAGAYLRRVIDTRLQPISIPREGIVLTGRLADILGVEVGDELGVEVLEGSRPTRRVRVAALAEQYVGIAAYMDLGSAHRLAGGGDAVTGAYLLVDGRHEEALTAALRRRPRVAGIMAQERAVRAMLETAERSMLVFTSILSLFAGVIAFGVVYNSARIALSERDRELASLRVLGFTRGEISYILLGELALLTAIAIPVGLVLGALLSGLAATALQNDLFQFPLVIGRGTLATSAAVVVVAAVASSLIVRRALDRLDLVGVLKTRE